MTSFWGYVTEGCFLLALALWWMVNTCAEIIKSKQEKRSFRPRITYPWPGTNAPVEIFYKLFISAFGLFGQLAYGEGQFHDEEGDFRSMNELMYMTIYGIFLLHSALDLAMWFHLPHVKESNYASAAIGFFWYAQALYSSTEDTEDGAVAVMARTFPVYILLPIGAAFILESLWRRETSVPVVRAFCLQTYATWCFQCAHMLHAGNAFPGSGPNPDWDLTDHRNVAYSAAFFGLHLCVNLVLTVATYTFTALFLRMRHGITIEVSDDLTSCYDYRRVPTSDGVAEVERESTVKLLASYSA